MKRRDETRRDDAFFQSSFASTRDCVPIDHASNTSDGIMEIVSAFLRIECSAAALQKRWIRGVSEFQRSAGNRSKFRVSDRLVPTEVRCPKNKIGRRFDILRSFERSPCHTSKVRVRILATPRYFPLGESQYRQGKQLGNHQIR